MCSGVPLHPRLHQASKPDLAAARKALARTGVGDRCPAGQRHPSSDHRLVAAELNGQTPGMDVLSAIRSKRDTRAFTDRSVPDDVLGRVLDAARMAGSAKNRQPVRLIVVTDPEVIEALKGPCDFAAWIHGAPVVVVGCVERSDSIRLQFDLCLLYTSPSPRD